MNVQSEINQFKKAKIDVQETERDLNTLKEKHSELSDHLEGIVTALKEAIEKRQEALKSFAMGKFDESLVSKIREDIEGLEKVELETKEMLAAIESGTTTLTKGMSTARNEVQTALKKIWQAIEKNLKASPPEEARRWAERLEAATFQARGAHQNPTEFRFAPYIPSDEQKIRLSEIKKEIEKEFGIF